MFFRQPAVLSSHGKCKNYLYTIAGNLCKNYAKKKVALPAEQEVLERELSFSDKLEQTEIKMDMEQALLKLPAELREPILLFYFQECKHTEIAEILQIGLPLVKYRLKRGKELLRDLLEDTSREGIDEKSALEDISEEGIDEKSALEDISEEGIIEKSALEDASGEKAHRRLK